MTKRNTYVKVYDNIDDHPGFMAVSTEALGLWLRALTYCHRNRTDGHFPRRAVDRWHDSESDAPAQLVMADRWHLDGHTCETCPQPEKGGLYLHAYLDENPSKSDLDDLSTKRAKAGSEGGRKRAANQLAKQEGDTSKQGSSQSNRDRDVDVKESGPRKRATQLPADFSPNDANRRIAEERGLDLPAVVAQFCDHHRAKGSTFKDWNLALNTWLRREQPSMFPTRQTTPPAERRTLAQCPDAQAGECASAHPWEDARNLYHCQGA